MGLWLVVTILLATIVRIHTDGVNVALNKPAYQISNLAPEYGANKAVDGDHESKMFAHHCHPCCAHTTAMYNAWWYVDLQAQYRVKSVAITNRDTQAELLKHFKIFVGNVKAVDYFVMNHVCHQNIEGTFVGESETREFVCDNGPLRGQYVIVQLLGRRQLVLCEVDVYGEIADAMMENTGDQVHSIALNKPAYQISNLAPEYGANKAVDGDHESKMFAHHCHPCCAHTTAMYNAWWYVDLQAQYRVKSVAITNRDTQVELLTNFKIFVGYVNDANQFAINPICGEGKYSGSGEAQEFVCNDGAIQGRYVIIQLLGKHPLVLCEVDVYGVKAFVPDPVQIDVIKCKAEPQHLLTPNYPDPYPSNTQVEWIIMTDVGMHIQLTFDHFDLGGGGSNCYKDYLEVYDDDELVIKMCEKYSYRTYKSTSIKLVLKFKSDNNGEFGGFNITWTVTCKSVALYKPAYQVSDLAPAYSANKAVDGDNNSTMFAHHCQPCCTHTTLMDKAWWYVDLQAEYEIGSVAITNRDSLAEFLTNYKILVGYVNDPRYFDVNPVCHYSQGMDVGPGEVQEFVCDPGPLQGQYVIIQLQVKHQLVLCEVDVYGKPVVMPAPIQVDISDCKAQPQDLLTPNYPDPYPSNTQVEWIIMTDVGMHIQLTFDHFDLGDGDPNCYKDYLEVYDGDTLAMKLCGARTHDVYTSTHNKMKLKFKSDNKEEFRGFIISRDLPLCDDCELAGCSANTTTHVSQCQPQNGCWGSFTYYFECPGASKQCQEPCYRCPEDEDGIYGMIL